MKHRPITLSIILFGLMSATAAAQAGTVENLERERALALKTSLSPDMSPSERESSMEVSRARLVD